MHGIQVRIGTFIRPDLPFSGGRGGHSILRSGPLPRMEWPPRSLEDEGATPFSAADRFGATVGFTVVPEKATLLAPLLATDCSFERWDVRDAKKTAETLVKEAEASAPVCFQSPSFCALFGYTKQFRPSSLSVSHRTHCLILHHTEIVYPLYRFLSLPAPCPFPYPS